MSFLYNDAFLDVIGIKHPAALGRPFRDVWPEVWNEIAPLVARTLAGESLSFENRPFTLLRKGYEELAWFSFSYSPLQDQKGAADAVPELEKQGFIALLNQVYASGKPHIGRSVPIEMRRPEGGVAQHYIDFIYQPITDANGQVSGIIREGGSVGSGGGE